MVHLTLRVCGIVRISRASGVGRWYWCAFRLPWGVIRARRWWVWLIAAVLLAFAVRFAARFPWVETGRVLAGASVPLLLLATLVNLASLVAKAAGWHLLLRRDGVPRWRSSLEATVIGAAVNSVGVAASGDAARVHVVVQRDGVALGAAVASLIWSRVVEGVGLAVMLVIGAALLPLPTWVQPIQAGLLAAIVALTVLTATGSWAALGRRLPAKVRPLLDRVAATAPRGRIVPVLAFALVNWLTQWITYHLAIASVEGVTPLAASFVAVLAANIGGLPKLTPGNVGVMQASFVLGLAPFGVPIERAIAAGLVCQALQVLPTLAAGVALAGWHGLRTTARASVDAA
jgi:uncharacterized membrane protein YbhN (UPF0104 family)